MRFFPQPIRCLAMLVILATTAAAAIVPPSLPPAPVDSSPQTLQGVPKTSDGSVVLTEQPRMVLLSNGIVSITVAKMDAAISRLTLGNSPNLAGRGAYFAVANSVGKDSPGDIKNADYKVVRKTPDLVELSFGAPIGGIYFTIHYVMRRGDQGFYVYVLQQRKPGLPPENTGQVRWSFYLNPTLFNYHLASDTEQGPIPDTNGAPSVQDATFRLSDGTIYTKYNYCNYLEDDFVHGLCGSKPGSYGAFIVMASHEYLQAPTKQEILVHAGPIIHAILQSGHFQPRDLASPPAPDGWTKLCGPWFVYVNKGDSPTEIWKDARAQADKEKAKWPYAWMQDDEYPLQRGEVSGTLRLYNGARPAANALMLLSAPDPNWQLQVLNYIFSVRADANGNFTLPNVRPGNYTLFATVPGVTDEFRQDHIVVAAGAKVNLGNVTFNPSTFSARLWEIGTADRRTTGFRLSDQPRQYGLDAQVPANLTYTIGTSVPSKDWYYLQKPGEWTIDFKTDRTYGGEGVLTIGIAGQTNNPNLQILLNDTVIGSYKGGNSSAAYRSAILGSSYYENEIYRFPASALHEGVNHIVLKLAQSTTPGPANTASLSSVMYDVLKLDIDDPSLPKTLPPDEAVISAASVPSAP